jgi:hypothetical protein
MTTPRDPDSVIAAWLEEGPNALPEPTRRAIVVNTRTMDQRRQPIWMPQRSPTMNPFARIAAAAIVVVAVLGGAVYLFSPGGGVGGGPPATAAASPAPSVAPSPSPSAVPTPTATPPSTVGWLPFTSSHYGYSIAYPPTWAATQATQAWDFAKDRLTLSASAPGGVWDVLLGNPPNGPETAVLGFAADVPAGTSEDAWLSSYYAGSGFCPTMPTFVPVTVDGHAGRLDPCYDAQAFVFVGNRVYVFVIYQTDMQPLFRAFLSTVKFPASPPSGSPAASASPG